MVWVCRAGQKSIYAQYYFESGKIYIPWDGFKEDLKKYHDRALLKELVIEEKGRVSRTSISNWAGQLYTFCQEMKIGDYVLIPANSSHQFTFARIAGDYEYNPQNKEGLWHSRDIGIIVDYIPSSIFSKSVRYSLGAYRTIFKAKDEEEILTEINKYIARKDL